MMQKEIKSSFVFIFVALIFCLSANVFAEQTEFYPTIFVHGAGSNPEDLITLIDKLKLIEHGEPYIIYAGDSDGLRTNSTNSYSPDSIWSFGYYKNSKNDPNSHGNAKFEASYEGRIGGIPIETTNPQLEARVEYSRQLQRTVDNILHATGARKVNLVGHCMGAMVARAYITWLGGDQKVNKFLSIGAPNHGISADDYSFLTLFGGYPVWMHHGEFNEINNACKPYYDGQNWRSFTEILDRDWVNIRSKFLYATIAGTYSPNITRRPDDGIVYVGSVQLEGAVFNATVFLAHTLLPGIFLIRTAVDKEEQALSHSTYTAVVIRRWFFCNQVNLATWIHDYGDSDGDSLLDSWEQQYFGNLSYGLNDDPDGDCWTNRQEYMRSTDPGNANSPGFWCPWQLWE